MLGICIFDLKFCYVLLSWEGFAHNNCALENEIYNHNFKIPSETFFLANTGYHNTDYVLYSYCNMRYHLKKQIASGLKSITKKELFNLCHSSFWNAVERIFGLIKR